MIHSRRVQWTHTQKPVKQVDFGRVLSKCCTFWSSRCIIWSIYVMQGISQPTWVTWRVHPTSAKLYARTRPHHTTNPYRPHLHILGLHPHYSDFHKVWFDQVKITGLTNTHPTCMAERKLMGFNSPNQISSSRTGSKQSLKSVQSSITFPHNKRPQRLICLLIDLN